MTSAVPSKSLEGSYRWRQQCVSPRQSLPKDCRTSTPPTTHCQALRTSDSEGGKSTDEDEQEGSGG